MHAHCTAREAATNHTRSNALLALTSMLHPSNCNDELRWVVPSGSRNEVGHRDRRAGRWVGNQTRYRLAPTGVFRGRVCFLARIHHKVNCQVGDCSCPATASCPCSDTIASYSCSVNMCSDAQRRTHAVIILVALTNTAVGIASGRGVCVDLGAARTSVGLSTLTPVMPSIHVL